MSTTRDEGFVTIAVAGLLLVLVCLGALAASLGAVAVARHRAAASADLAALAGARHWREGAAAACAVARGVAQDQGAALESCTLDGEVVTVRVAVRPPGPVGRLGAARARARAGPLGLAGGVQGPRGAGVLGVPRVFGVTEGPGSGRDLIVSCWAAGCGGCCLSCRGAWGVGVVRALMAVVEGVIDGRVDDLVVAVGGTGSHSEVPGIWSQLAADDAIWRPGPARGVPVCVLGCNHLQGPGLVLSDHLRAVPLRCLPPTFWMRLSGPLWVLVIVGV